MAFEGNTVILQTCIEIDVDLRRNLSATPNEKLLAMGNSCQQRFAAIDRLRGLELDRGRGRGPVCRAANQRCDQHGERPSVGIAKSEAS